MQAIVALTRAAYTQQSQYAASLTRETGIPSCPRPTQVRTNVCLQNSCTFPRHLTIRKDKCLLIDLIVILIPVPFSTLDKQ